MDNPEFTVEDICDKCHEQKTLYYLKDPYASEILDDDTMYWMCMECFDNSCDEI
jgi:hypothetical protein